MVIRNHWINIIFILLYFNIELIVADKIQYFPLSLKNTILNIEQGTVISESTEHDLANKGKFKLNFELNVKTMNGTFAYYFGASSDAFANYMAPDGVGIMIKKSSTIDFDNGVYFVSQYAETLSYEYVNVSTVDKLEIEMEYQQGDKRVLLKVNEKKQVEYFIEHFDKWKTRRGRYSGFFWTTGTNLASDVEIEIDGSNDYDIEFTQTERDPQYNTVSKVTTKEDFSPISLRAESGLQLNTEINFVTSGNFIFSSNLNLKKPNLFIKGNNLLTNSSGKMYGMHDFLQYDSRISWDGNRFSTFNDSNTYVLSFGQTKQEAESTNFPTNFEQHTGSVRFYIENHGISLYVNGQWKTGFGWAYTVGDLRATEFSYKEFINYSVYNVHIGSLNVLEYVGDKPISTPNNNYWSLSFLNFSSTYIFKDLALNFESKKGLNANYSKEKLTLNLAKDSANSAVVPYFSTDGRLILNDNVGNLVYTLWNRLKVQNNDGFRLTFNLHDLFLTGGSGDSVMIFFGAKSVEMINDVIPGGMGISYQIAPKTDKKVKGISFIAPDGSITNISPSTYMHNKATFCEFIFKRTPKDTVKIIYDGEIFSFDIPYVEDWINYYGGNLIGAYHKSGNDKSFFQLGNPTLTYYNSTISKELSFNPIFGNELSPQDISPITSNYYLSNVHYRIPLVSNNILPYNISKMAENAVFSFEPGQKYSLKSQFNIDYPSINISFSFTHKLSDTNKEGFSFDFIFGGLVSDYIELTSALSYVSIRFTQNQISIKNYPLGLFDETITIPEMIEGTYYTYTIGYDKRTTRIIVYDDNRKQQLVAMASINQLWGLLNQNWGIQSTGNTNVYHVFKDFSFYMEGAIASTSVTATVTDKSVISRTSSTIEKVTLTSNIHTTLTHDVVSTVIKTEVSKSITTHEAWNLYTETSITIKPVSETVLVHEVDLLNEVVRLYETTAMITSSDYSIVSDIITINEVSSTIAIETMTNIVELTSSNLFFESDIKTEAEILTVSTGSTKIEVEEEVITFIDLQLITSKTITATFKAATTFTATPDIFSTETLVSTLAIITETTEIETASAISTKYHHTYTTEEKIQYVTLSTPETEYTLETKIYTSEVIYLIDVKTENIKEELIVYTTSTKFDEASITIADIITEITTKLLTIPTTIDVPLINHISKTITTNVFNTEIISKSSIEVITNIDLHTNIEYVTITSPPYSETTSSEETTSTSSDSNDTETVISIGLIAGVSVGSAAFIGLTAASAYYFLNVYNKEIPISYEIGEGPNGVHSFKTNPTYATAQHYHENTLYTPPINFEDTYI